MIDYITFNKIPVRFSENQKFDYEKKERCAQFFRRSQSIFLIIIGMNGSKPLLPKEKMMHIFLDSHRYLTMKSLTRKRFLLRPCQILLRSDVEKQITNHKKASAPCATI